ncbi:MAG: bifunctional glutamate N-acetyltransferase/amino-acid acetyltransferase ArgJ [Candidatus Altiarchaeota archaeon]
MEFRQTRYGVCLPGFRAGGAKRGKYGVALIVADEICDVAAVFTRNSVKAAPLKYTKGVLKNGIQVVVANSGNANCCVPTGMSDARKMAQETANSLRVNAKNVAVSSTGIIGRPMDISTVVELIHEVAGNLSSGPKGSIQAAKAIMTTDTKIKMYSAEYAGIKVGGICKGAGMIAPNMATMLCYITTNARLPKGRMQAALNEAAEDSFNMLSVDGDMSTNDTVIVLSNRVKKCRADDFRALLAHVSVELAKMIARDGEGASKFLEVEVKGAKSVKEARCGVKSIINSPLVKTAFYGENPNWGRIVSSLGSVLKVDESKVDITFHSGRDYAKLLSFGKPMSLDHARKILTQRNIKVVVDLHDGEMSAVGWGCDMTPKYVDINAGYS